MNSLNLLVDLTFVQFLFFLSVFILFCGLFGLIWPKYNWVLYLFNFELCYLGIIFSLTVGSYIFNYSSGLIFAFLFLVVAAAETAIGLSILIVNFRFNKTINCVRYNELWG